MSKFIVGLVVVAVVGVGVYYAVSKKSVENLSAPSAAESSIISSSTAEVVVQIKNFSFNPSTITVKKGTKVTWKNDDDVAHTATADSGLFDSGLLSKGQSFSYVFSAVGSEPYYCRPHPRMRATVVVEE